jgi:hypothetical protein
MMTDEEEENTPDNEHRIQVPIKTYMVEPGDKEKVTLVLGNDWVLNLDAADGDENVDKVIEALARDDVEIELVVRRRA